MPNDDEYLGSVGITYTDIMRLNELGLMFNDGLISLNMRISSESRILISSHSLLTMISSSSGKPEDASISQYPFTEVGKELSTLISESASDEDFLKYGEVLSHNKSYKISVHKIIEWVGNSVRYETQNLIPRDASPTNNE